MENLKQLEQIFVNNLGNKLTVELSNGMLHAILKVIEAEYQPDQKAE